MIFLLLGVLAALLSVDPGRARAFTVDAPDARPSSSADPASLKPSRDPTSKTMPPSSPDSAIPKSTPNLPASVQAAADRRSRFVYQLPNGSIWDSYQYVQMRTALAEFDGLKAGATPAGRVAAWGFKSGKRSVASTDNRPHPLWVSLQAAKGSEYTPFIYVNSSLLSPREKKSETYLKLGKQRGASVFEFTFSEYPGDQFALGHLPLSIPLGYATGVVELPSGLNATAGASLAGEFILLPLTTTPPSGGGLPENPTHKLYHASSFRMTGETYSRALADGRASLVEWGFQRQPSSFGDKYIWTRSIVCQAPSNSSSPSQP